MNTPPIKRHPALQPLSREHLSGLIQARNVAAAAESRDSHARRRLIVAFTQAWNEELAPHFLDEEQMLAGLVSATDLKRLHTEHDELRTLAVIVTADRADARTLARLGSLLHDHIRWEERHLFASAEAAASADDLNKLEIRAAKIEQERPGSCARRRL